MLFMLGGVSGGKNEHLMEVWHARVIAARKQYDVAVRQTRMASQDFRVRQLPTPDGGAKLVGTLKAERQARDEYMRALRIFSDLVLRGVGPDE